mgnify:FL=1
MTSAQRDGLKDAVLALTEPMIDDLVKDISRRIKGTGAITETAEYQIYRAQALGASKKEVERRVAEQLKLQEEVISSLFEYVLDKSLAYEDNGSLQQMADAYAEMTKSKTAEMLQNLWGTAPDGQVLPLQDAYARALDFAFRETATGVLDMETAIRRAVMPLAKRGLRTIEQKSGRSIGIEYACRRYIMDQLGALDDEVQKANHDRLGCDGWEISAHAACAPDHEPIQGRQYSDAEYEQLNNSLQRRIGHLNCGHTASPIILGVNAPQYTEAELKQFAEDNERGITYNGKHYTLYQAGQEQATMENAIRNLRRQILADEETKSPDLQKHQIRLRVLQSEYTKFCKAANLPTRNERLQVAGFGRSQASKAVWTYRRSKVSDVQIQGHTLYSVTEERINAVPAPSFRGLTNKANGKAQGYARELLRKVQNKALGTEAIVDFTADGYVRYSVGASGKMQVASPELSVPYYSLHNHASNDILSPEDVQRLIKYPNMKGVGAVGHAGALYTCEKVYGYNLERARNWFKSLKQKYPLYKGNTDDLEEALAQRVAFAEELRRDGVKYGLIFSG